MTYLRKTGIVGIVLGVVSALMLLTPPVEARTNNGNWDFVSGNVKSVAGVLDIAKQKGGTVRRDTFGTLTVKAGETVLIILGRTIQGMTITVSGRKLSSEPLIIGKKSFCVSLPFQDGYARSTSKVLRPISSAKGCPVKK